MDVSCLPTAQVNPNMPRTFGDGVIHMSHCDVMVNVNDPLPELHIPPTTQEESKIGSLISENLVQDGATLQMGKNNYFVHIVMWP